jgi:serine/threonine-protein phosphatase 4 catalytic subunit
MMLKFKLIVGLMTLASAHLSLRSFLNSSFRYTPINDRPVNMQISLLVHETGIVEKVLRCYNKDPDTDKNHARIARYLLSSKNNKFAMFLKDLGEGNMAASEDDSIFMEYPERKDIELLAYMMRASAGICRCRPKLDGQRLIITRPFREEFSIQLSSAFDTEETKLVDVLQFFLSDAEAKEKMQMSEYIRTKNFLLHAFLGEYCENGAFIGSMNNVMVDLIAQDCLCRAQWSDYYGKKKEYDSFCEEEEYGSPPSGILRDILTHVDKQEENQPSHENLKSLKNCIDHNLSSSVVIQQLYGSYGRQTLPALFREHSLYDYENKDILSILLLDKLDTDKHRLEALDLMFPESACRGEILEEVIGHMDDDKSVGDPIEYFYKKGNESIELPQKMGEFLFKNGLVNMFLHWSRTGDASLIRDVSDEITFRNYVRMARGSDPKEIYDLIERVGYGNGRKQEVLLCLISERLDFWLSLAFLLNEQDQDLLTLLKDPARPYDKRIYEEALDRSHLSALVSKMTRSAWAYNERNYEEALECIKKAASRSEWCISRLCMIHLKLGRYYEFRECYDKLENKRINPRLSRMVEKLPASEDEPRMDFNSILEQVNGIISAERVRRICDTAVKVLANSDNVVHVRGKDVMVVGDTHGQLDDVVKLVEENWEKGRIFVFNGDFVDRGRKQALNFLFLLLLKINFPDRVFLNRGDHEDPEINSRYGLFNEVEETYGSEYKCVLTCFSDVYAVLPLATIINEEVFVVHGGLHYESISIERDVQPVERRVVHYNTMIFRNFLWADPGSETHFNWDRGTGFYFGPEITKAFLRDNNLKLVARSHEFTPEGYKTDHDGNVVTVHSAPGYKGIEAARGRYLLFYHGEEEEGLEKVTHNDITYFVGEMAPADQ